MIKPKAYIIGSVYLPADSVDTRAIEKDLYIAEQEDPKAYKELREIKLYHYELIHNKKYIAVPRVYGDRFLDDYDIVDWTATGDVGCLSSLKQLVPRPHQPPFIDNVEQLLKDHFDVVGKAGTGMGKDQPYSAKVLTQEGFVSMGSLQINDTVVGGDGLPTKVSAIYEQGLKPTYKVTFKDGTSTRCGLDHLWSVRTRKGKHGNKDYTTKTLEDIIQDYRRVVTDKRHPGKQYYDYKYHIPVNSAVEFKEHTNSYLLLDPYMLGLLIGDGGLTNRGVRFTNSNTQIVDKLEDLLPAGDKLNRLTHIDHSITSIRGGPYPSNTKVRLDVMGLHGKLSKDKFIPNKYLSASVQDRRRLLQGLLDTDGFAMPSGMNEYSTSSARLSEDVAYLARSLGYIVRVKKRAASYTKNGIDHTGFTSYRVYIYGEYTRVLKTIVNIEKDISEKSRCIVVDNKDHLYITDDFIVTHNTAMAVEIARRLNTSTLIIVDQTKLELQWVDTLTRLFGMSEDDIGYYNGRSKEYEGKAVCLATIQTLYRAGDTLADFYDTYGLTIIDENHSAGSQKYGTILMNLSSQYRLGVSATTDRGDLFQKVLDYNLGEVAYTLATKHEESSVRYIEYPRILSSYANTATQAGTYESDIAADGVRSLLIANAIKMMYDKGRDILVIGSRTTQLHSLMILCEFMGIPEEDMGVYSQKVYKTGYSKDKKPPFTLDEWDEESYYTPIKYDTIPVSSIKKRKELQDKALEAKIVFSTYSMFSKGVDVPRLSVGIDITPRSKVVQTHGRILRSVEGKPAPIWVTIRDYNNIRAESQFTRRLADYSKSNANVIKHWDLDKGVRDVDPMILKRDVKRNSTMLSQSTSIRKPNGEYEYRNTQNTERV